MLSSSFTWFWLCFWGLGLPSWAPSIVTIADSSINCSKPLVSPLHCNYCRFKYKLLKTPNGLLLLFSGLVHAVVVQWISSLEANSSPVSIEVRFSFVCLGQSTLSGKFKVLLPWTPKTELSWEFFPIVLCVSINGITSYTPTYYILYIDKCVKV